jgi:exosortase/archaeosortase family protein
MKNQYKKILFVFFRYFSVLLLGLGNLYLFYKILTPITIKTVSGILSIFGASISNDIIHFGNSSFEIVPACVAGAAYYLLFILIMTTKMEVKTRIKALGVSLGVFFILNIFRLVALILLVDSPSFELIHWIFWHILSTILVVGIWFGTVKLFNIKSIPAYGDILDIAKLRTHKGKALSKKRFKTRKSNPKKPKRNKKNN